MTSPVFYLLQMIHPSLWVCGMSRGGLSTPSYFHHFFNLLVSLDQGSAADGPRGLSVGDIVTGLEDCPVRGVEDWSSCLFHLSHTSQTGYCVPVASLQPSWAHGRGERTAPRAPPPTSYCDAFNTKGGQTHRAAAAAVIVQLGLCMRSELKS